MINNRLIKKIIKRKASRSYVEGLVPIADKEFSFLKAYMKNEHLLKLLLSRTKE